ncbi:hypothetical protein J2W28_006479 [Variovorax boronicumulans]|uniref:DUF3540 domain-containing protein n=1 Tax=Variovorax boronicumulans TaxID=436515 RepID=UPI00277E9089|nr:DUF3540 domain-containing protein [Variovorax boronicumulans]MDP9994095.1 hypothetical protein [Variovorax boronicumulans]MDQ0007303.1 hypothetical protein [Variovorax boronicumulans]
MNETMHKTAAPRARRRQPAKAITGEWCVGVLSTGHTGKEGALVVASGDLRLHATRAASCLLEPAAGDSVACLRIAPNEVWIMAVLQREESTPNVVSCAGHMRIAVQGGALELEAARVGLKSQQLDIATEKTTVATETADVVGRQLRVIGTSIKVIGSIMSSVMDRVQHFSKSYLRTTEGIDRVAATHLECEATQLMRLEGEHTLINGRELIKARGAQIHFG